MEKIKYLVDTCIFIDAFRGNKRAKDLLNSIKDKIAISCITEMELYMGAKTKERKKDLEKQLKIYSKVLIDVETCNKAIQLMKKYNSKNRDLHIADCFIASTSLVNNYPLVTNNISDFDFIEGLRFFKAN